MKKCDFNTEAYKEYIQINLAKGTVDGYTATVKRFIDFIKKHPKLTTINDVEDYVMSMTKKNLSATLIGMRVAALDSYFRYLKKKNIFALSFSITGEVKRPKVILREQIVRSAKDVLLFIEKIERDESVDAFLTARDTLAILIAATTGARVNEIRNLNLSNIDIEKKQIFFYHTKNKKPRVLSLFDNVLKKLNEYLLLRQKMLEVKNEVQALFISRRFKRMNASTFMLAMNKYSKRYSTKITWHSMRRGFATDLSNQGVSVEKISKALGHSSVAVTSERYIYTSFDEMEAALSNHPLFTQVVEETKIPATVDNTEAGLKDLLNIFVKSIENISFEIKTIKTDMQTLTHKKNSGTQ